MVDYTQFVKPYKAPELSNDVHMDIDFLDATICAKQIYEKFEREERRLKMEQKGKFIIGDKEYTVHDAEIVLTPGCEGRLTARVSEYVHKTRTERYLVVVGEDKEQLSKFKDFVVQAFRQLKTREKDAIEIFSTKLIGIPLEKNTRNFVSFEPYNTQGCHHPETEYIHISNTKPSLVAAFLLGSPMDIGPIDVITSTSMHVVSCSYMINRFYELDIEKIEVNNRKDTVAVFWENNNFPEDSEFGTSDRVTVVKRQAGEPFNIFNAVAAAFCINKYKTRSHFRKVLRDKYGTEDVYNTVAMFELVEHFGSIDQVKKIVEDRTEYLYPIDKIIEVENEFNKNLRNNVYADISKDVKKCIDFMKEQFGDALKNIDLNKLK